MYIQPKARIHLLPALSSPIVVVLRRKPSKQFHVMVWNTDTDKIEYGTWFVGKLYVERCDVSPDGQYLVYMAIGRDGKVWTGVSRPPFLTTLKHYNQVETYSGGGCFSLDGTLKWCFGQQSIELKSPAAKALASEIAQLEQKSNNWQPKNRKEKEEHANLRKKLLAKKRKLYNMNPNNAIKLPFATEEHSFTGEYGILEERMKRDGWLREGEMPEAVRTYSADMRQCDWIVTNDPGWSLPLSPNITLRCFYEGYFSNGGYQYRFSIDQYPDLLKEGVSWACRDSNGGLIVARNGALEKYTIKDLATQKPSFYLDLETLIPPVKPQKTNANSQAPK